MPNDEGGVQRAWWKEAVCYQIYPNSFLDSNGDGRGDIPGIIARLDYLQDLGVDVLWVSPFLEGPGVDEGYDISNYRDIDPKYGTLADFDALVDGLHKRGMKFMMDAVLNHTSDQHPWFLESKASRANPKREWYIWREPRWRVKAGAAGEYTFVPPGTAGAERYPPNNWASLFGGSAWEWYDETEMYGLHIFAKEQPDLNWANPEVRKQIFDDCNWWLARGVDGFRLDAITHISKSNLADAPVSDPNEEWQNCYDMFNHAEGVHDYLQEFHREVLSKWDVMTVGEAGGTSPKQAMDYINQDRENKEIQAVFNTDHLDLYGPFDDGNEPERKLSGPKGILTMWQQHMHAHGGWNSVTGGSHDQPRSLTRFGTEDPALRVQAAKALAVLWLSLAGTPYVYQGDELGMINLPWEWDISEYKDLVSQRHYARRLEERKQKEENPDMSGVMAGLRRKARDNARSPFPWDASEKGGFTTGKPWMNINPDNKVCNAEAQIGKPDSVLSFYKRMIKVRKANHVLVYGEYKPYDFPGHEETIFAFTRTEGDKSTFTLCNLSEEAVSVDLPHGGRVLIATWDFEGKVPEKLTVGPYEAVLYEIEG